MFYNYLTKSMCVLLMTCFFIPSHWLPLVMHNQHCILVQSHSITPSFIDPKQKFNILWIYLFIFHHLTIFSFWTIDQKVLVMLFKDLIVQKCRYHCTHLLFRRHFKKDAKFTIHTIVCNYVTYPNFVKCIFHFVNKIN